MKSEIKKQWVDALHSEEYKQGTGGLRTGQDRNEYCCLGVLCDLHAKATGTAWQRNNDNGSNTLKYLTTSGYLPTAVCDWAGVAEEVRHDVCRQACDVTIITAAHETLS